MEANDISEQITALVDNEIKGQDEVKRLQEVMDHDSYAKIDYLIQSTLKTTVKSHVPYVETPGYLQERIIRQIKIELLSPSVKKTKRFRWLESIFSPKVAFASAFVIIVFFASLIYFFNSSSPSNDNSQFHNLLVQARQNFQNFNEGKLPLQFASNSAEVIKKFFREKGVKFDPLVPEFKDWELQGAAVSENGGEKLPHNIYKGKDGKLVYLYQVDDNCLKKKIVSLSGNVSKVLDDGKYYKISDGNQSALVWKCKGKVCVVVSNDNINKVENRFLAFQDKW